MTFLTQISYRCTIFNLNRLSVVIEERAADDWVAGGKWTRFFGFFPFEHFVLEANSREEIFFAIENIIRAREGREPKEAA